MLNWIVWNRTVYVFLTIQILTVMGGKEKPYRDNWMILMACQGCDTRSIILCLKVRELCSLYVYIYIFRMFVP